MGLAPSYTVGYGIGYWIHTVCNVGRQFGDAMGTGQSRGGYAELKFGIG